MLAETVPETHPTYFYTHLRGWGGVRWQAKELGVEGKANPDLNILN